MMLSHCCGTVSRHIVEELTRYKRPGKISLYYFDLPAKHTYTFNFPLYGTFMNLFFPKCVFLFTLICLSAFIYSNMFHHAVPCCHIDGYAVSVKLIHPAISIIILPFVERWNVFISFLSLLCHQCKMSLASNLILSLHKIKTEKKSFWGIKAVQCSVTT